MRLAEGLFLDKEKTFGNLRFSAMRREKYEFNYDGSVSDTVKSRTYDLKSSEQERMIQVTIPATVDIKDFALNTSVELINPVLGTVTNVTYQTVDVKWYLNADDIILKNKKTGETFKSSQPQINNTPVQSSEIKNDKK